MGNINKTCKICSIVFYEKVHLEYMSDCRKNIFSKIILYYEKGYWEYMSHCRKKIFCKLMSLNMTVWVETAIGMY